MSQFTHRAETIPDTEWQAVYLGYEGDDPATSTSIAFAPGQGSNLFRFAVGGTDYMYGIGNMGGQTRIVGSPILYPTPNRVRNATFTFDGRVFEFEPNDGTRFLHGLVRAAQWEVGEPTEDSDGISIETQIRFVPGTPWYERFPVENTLALVYRVEPRTVHMDFTVTNDDAEHRLPFGLAIHPFFAIHGGRESVKIEVPATHWMEAEDLMPTGRLIDIAEGPADIRKPTPLAELNLDDVFYGLERARPQVAYYESLGTKLTLTADDFFTHSVVFTPPQAPFFCIENQSCSTDAHNLYAEGFDEAAHLTILEPGDSLSASISFTVTDL
jgi:aldose 1-epimerase